MSMQPAVKSSKPTSQSSKLKRLGSFECFTPYRDQYESIHTFRITETETNWRAHDPIWNVSRVLRHPSSELLDREARMVRISRALSFTSFGKMLKYKLAIDAADSSAFRSSELGHEDLATIAKSLAKQTKQNQKAYVRDAVDLLNDDVDALPELMVHMYAPGCGGEKAALLGGFVLGTGQDRTPIAEVSLIGKDGTVGRTPVDLFVSGLYFETSP